MTVSKLTGTACEHRVATTRTYDSVRKLLIEIAMCHECGAWLSLGKSNDEPAAVKVEMRAAELVQDIENIGATVLNRASFEAYGMNMFHNEPNETAPANAGEEAGYLAAAIVGHEEGES